MICGEVCTCRQASEVPEKAASAKTFSMIDYGVLSYGKGEPFHRRFLVSAGIGFDAAVCQAALDSRLRSRLGHMGFRRLSYLLLGIGQFLNAGLPEDILF